MKLWPSLTAILVSCGLMIALCASPALGAAMRNNSANDLDALLAPIALYPDALVAQILTCATKPDQVAT